MPAVFPSNHWHRETREKVCVMCHETLSLADFYSYPYTTNQGKRSLRYESRCKACSKERRRVQYHANPERDRSVTQAWRARNKEAIQEQTKHRQQNDPWFRAIKATAQRRRKARMRSSSGSPRLDGPQIRALYAEAVRLSRTTGIAHHVDHIIPLKHGGKHVIENLQIITATENMKKGARLPRPAITQESEDA